ncbi:MAG: LEA type 2 family protein [Candidatus Altiarchaeota archaeon]
MKPVFLLFLLLIFTAIALYLGIYLWTNISKQPEVSVSGVEYRVAEKISILGAEVPTKIALLVHLEVYNPNIISITVTDASYQVYLNSMPVGEGTVTGPVEIQAKAKTTTTSEVKISSLQAVAGMLETADTGTLKAKINGTINIKIPIIGTRPVYLNQETEILKIN